MVKMSITDSRAPIGELYYINTDNFAIIKLIKRWDGYKDPIGSYIDYNSTSLQYEDLWSGEIKVLDSRSVMAQHFHLIDEGNRQYIINRVFDGS